MAVPHRFLSKALVNSDVEQNVWLRASSVQGQGLILLLTRFGTLPLLRLLICPREDSACITLPHRSLLWPSTSRCGKHVSLWLQAQLPARSILRISIGCPALTCRPQGFSVTVSALVTEPPSNTAAPSPKAAALSCSYHLMMFVNWLKIANHWGHKGIQRIVPVQRRSGFRGKK